MRLSKNLEALIKTRPEPGLGFPEFVFSRPQVYLRLSSTRTCPRMKNMPHLLLEIFLFTNGLCTQAHIDGAHPVHHTTSHQPKPPNFYRPAACSHQSPSGTCKKLQKCHLGKILTALFGLWFYRATRWHTSGRSVEGGRLGRRIGRRKRRQGGGGGGGGGAAGPRAARHTSVANHSISPPMQSTFQSRFHAAHAASIPDVCHLVCL